MMGFNNRSSKKNGVMFILVSYHQNMIMKIVIFILLKLLKSNPKKSVPKAQAQKILFSF